MAGSKLTFMGERLSSNDCLNELAFGSGSATVTENLTKIGGTAIDTNSGAKSAGTQRVVIATDQPAFSVVAGGNTKNTSATYSPSLFQNLGANATLNVKASAGNVFSLTCYNANAAARYVQLHNTATVPTTTVTVPIFSFLVPSTNQIIVGTDFFTNDGCNFATGIAFAFSTTRDVYTAGSAGDQSTYVQYK